ncbi:MAG: hypothetical protein ACKVU1_02480 [bacterium]
MKTPTRKAAKKAAPKSSRKAQIIGGISTEAVEKATGKGWTEWLRILDAAGARKMNHKEIVAVVTKAHRVSPWWRQMVTVGYEQARGLRVAHQKVDGFSASRSKTVAAPIAVLYAAWSDARVRARWLGPDAKSLVVSTSTKNKSLRAVWQGGASRVNVTFWAKGAAKSQVAVEHNKLASESDVALMKAFWGEALERMRGAVEKKR